MKILNLQLFKIKIFYQKLFDLSLLKIFLLISRIFHNNNLFFFSEIILKFIEKLFKKNFYIQVEFAQIYKKRKDYKNLIKVYDKGINFTKGEQKKELLFMALSDSFNILKNKKLYVKYFNKLYGKKILDNQNIFPVVIKFSVKDRINIDKEIYNYKLKNPINTFSYHGHYNIYQSEHNIYKKKKFKEYSLYLKKNYIEKVLSKIFKDEIKIEFKKMWFVITKKFGTMKWHNHPDGHFSGVLYYQTPNVKASGYLKIFNPLKNINFFEIKKNKITRKKIKFDELILKPNTNDVFLFSSFLLHAVGGGEDIDLDRISIPFDFKLS